MDESQSCLIKYVWGVFENKQWIWSKLEKWWLEGELSIFVGCFLLWEETILFFLFCSEYFYLCKFKYVGICNWIASLPQSVRHTSYSQQCGEGVYSLYLDTILHRLQELMTEYQIYVQVWLIQSPRENCK